MTIENATANPNRPLLDWLLRAYPDTPKKRAKEWIQAGRVSIDGIVIRQPHQLLPDPGDKLQLLDRQATSLNCGRSGWEIHARVTLLYLDAALAVVSKGPGLLAVSAEPDDLSAQSILKDFLAGKLRGRPVPPAYRRLEPLPVHRLDQYTSGVFCMAMNSAARERLIEQVKQHTMQREYVAFVEGRPAKPKGTWRNWLKLSSDEQVQSVLSKTETGATEAITHYEVIAEFRPANLTKLLLRLETGLRHQIRIQVAHAGLPLIGDRKYNPQYRGRFPRQALHAATLTLEHPGRPGMRMTWTAPLPRDLAQLETALRSKRG